ncbi:FMN-binding protein [Streptomyces sp. GMY02]|uniref:FMN-binding protein n=1 Tax=Streptomyces sp. GMY02 TaxID=1333528 RepID=UPI001C2BB916|nr:FMN-binding protein [Streptomyces sp. GMY02]QXE37787.1 FMN-binding protein [Streptomyces sp. GMY02]
MKRRHPFRRIMVGVAATATGVVLLLALKQPGGSSVAGATARGGTGVPPAASAPASAPAPGRASGSDAAGTPAEGGDGGAGAGARTVVGDAVDTQYGPVQVRITLSGGRITAADAVKAPDSDAQSQSVTANAVPRLNQSAVTAQNARIDTVSGASYTSEGYRNSLQSALDKAGV